MTITEYLVAQLQQPVLVTVKEGDKTVRKNATDPRDGHEMTAKEAIAMKILQNALNGDLKSASFIMEQERMEKQYELMKKKMR